MSYKLFTKDKGTIGAEVHDVAVGSDYTDMLEEVVEWSVANEANLKPLHVQAVAGLALYKPLQGWEASLPDSRRVFVVITEDDDEETEQ